MSVEKSSVSMKVRRGFVNYNHANVYGVISDGWPHDHLVNKEVEEALTKLFSRVPPSGGVGARTRRRYRYLDASSSSWICPRIFITSFSHQSDRSNLIRHFNVDRVRNFLEEHGTPVERFDESTLELDYRLRQAMDLVRHIRCKAKVSRPDDVDSRPENSKQNTEDNTKRSYRSRFRAYNSPFEIRLATPDGNPDYVSTNAPSVHLLFSSLVDSVYQVLLCITRGNSIDLGPVEDRCVQLDLFLGRRGLALQYVRDMLADYSSWGYLQIDDDTGSSNSMTLEEIFNKVHHVDASLLDRVGRTVADIGFSFAPCGCMVPYHLGVLSLLSELNIINMTTPLAGGSAGTLSVIAATSMKPDLVELMLITEDMCEDVHVNGSFHRLDDLVKSSMEQWMLPGTYLAVNNRIGELRVAMAVRRHIKYEGRQISQFHDNVDLRDAVRASCNIPGISTASAVYFRGEKCYDGYFAAHLREHGCRDTSASRTIRVNPFQIGRVAIGMQKLENRYVSPVLTSKDPYIVHYLRLKCLLRGLLERKLSYEAAGRSSDWIHELSLMTEAYDSLLKGETGVTCHPFSGLLRSRMLNGCLRSRQTIITDSYVSSCDSPDELDTESDLANLFMLVVASEIALKVGPSSRFSMRNWYGSLQGVDLVSRFGRNNRASVLSKANLVASPYCLIDWLHHEMSVSTDSGNVDANIDTINHELKVLKELRHVFLPPLSLCYYYTEFCRLLPNTMSNAQRISVALNSSQKADIRYVFDSGRSDAFRWLICEYISFENWLDLRIRQLEERGELADPFFHPWEDKVRDSITTEGDAKLLLHERQHVELMGLLKCVDCESVLETLSPDAAASDVSSSLSHMLESLQSRVARRAILLNAIDPHYSHLLGHPQFWKH
ncbi:uncharacterized protein BXIN_1469 [Babesia sp. Xinjiang]|uniref:uncharacterized protein n=1 Tax=Babesia sp. Xinjiang TaxID=462227 RepID=UPI000A235741|nr:uncharacterized protein BXIN_1469 [Babesia sp. Xinjiang]ORM40036.1 hypothetical protein BXIN_1469 [Babesia sp. Xinjiang]